jgi:ribonuclease III
VRVGGRLLGSGVGRSKKAAEQQAAETAWRTITAETADGNGERPGHQDNGEDPGPAPAQ